jgi:hypothetical protein
MRLSYPHALFGVFSLSPLVVSGNSQGIAYPSFRYVEYTMLNADTAALATRLGYDAAKWNNPGTNPTENSAYANLGGAQQTITDLGFDSDQWDCYVNHYLDPFYFWDEIKNSLVKVNLMRLGWDADSWDSRSSPESYDKSWDELTDQEQASAVELCYFEEIWDQEALDTWTIAYPSFRYVQYATLDADTAALATRLGYDAANWNNPGTNPIEGSAYANLGQAQQTITDLGFDSDQWDCYVNHYLDPFYFWDELKDDRVKQNLMGLGWEADSWDSRSSPESYNKYWDDLTEEEQANAANLCYFQETWDEEALDTWTPLPAKSLVARGVEFPNFRYLQWAYMDSTELAQAFSLGYNEDTWNLPGTNPLELIGFSGQGNGQEELLALGFTAASWDCFVNHYQYFEWDGLGNRGVQQYYTTLGFTEATWINRDVTVPDAFDTPWEDLSTEHQAAAEQLCYFLDTWDKMNLIYWTTIPPEFAPSGAPSVSGSVSPSFMEDPSGDINEQNQPDSAVLEGYGVLVSTVSIFLYLLL